MKKTLRIVSLCPSNTEILAALGLMPWLVGVDNYSDYPDEELKNVQRLGPDLNIDMQKLISLHPDLTVASLSVPGMERVVEELKETGVNHIVLSPHRLNEIFADMRTVAKACGEFVDFEALNNTIAAYEKRVSNIRQATETVKIRPKLYFEWWAKPIFSPARQNWLTEISELAGAQNIFADIEGHQYKGDGAEVFTHNPDYFFAVWTGISQNKVPVSKIKSRPGWSELKAFTDERFFILSEGLYCRPSPRLIDGLEQLVGLIHPELAQKLGLRKPESYAPIRDFNGEWLGGITE
jgi:iron complex transport system substrate-binding protein